MDNLKDIYGTYLEIYSEGVVSEHPDISGQKEFAKKADEILANRRKKREESQNPQKMRERKAVEFFKKSKIREEKDHEHSMARSELHKIDKAIKVLRKKLKGEGNIEAWVQSKITRAADYLDSASNYVDSGEHNNIEEELISEREMTAGEMKKEKKLKTKYDTSGMKKSMIDQYGKEKGTQIYFATIRKQAMANSVELEGDQLDEIAPLAAGALAAGAVAAPFLLKKFVKPKIDKAIDKPATGSGSLIDKMKQKRDMMNQMNSFEFEGDSLEEKKLSRTAKRAARAGKPGYDAEGKPKPKGKVRAWDMDETLMRNDPKKIRVHVKDKEGKRVQSLTNQEFNVHKLDKDKGHSYDFGEFRSSEKFSKASKPNKSMIKKLKKQVRRGKPVHIVTARGSFDDQPKFAKHLRRHGIEIDKGKGKGGRHVHVHRAGDMPGSDIGEKKVKIVKGLMKKHGTSGAEMYDDAAKVHRAFKKSAKETPTQPKVKTKMVQPNKKDKTQARSFKENIDFDLIYDFILEQLIVEGYSNSYDESVSLINEFSDELLEDLILESYGIIESTLEQGLEIMEENQSKINYVSPYGKNKEESEIYENFSDVEMTPYQYWKSFIGDDGEGEEIVNEEIEEDSENLEEEVEMTTYQKWKQYLGED